MRIYAILHRFMADAVGDQRQAASGQSAAGGTDPAVANHQPSTSNQQPVISNQQLAATFPPPPPIPGGEEVYDRIMGGIEPELTTAQLPLLKEKYANETPEAAKARADRYEKAFQEYDVQYAAFQASQAQGIHSYEKQFMQGVQAVEASVEASKLDQISSAISSL